MGQQGWGVEKVESEMAEWIFDADCMVGVAKIGPTHSWQVFKAEKKVRAIFKQILKILCVPLSILFLNQSTASCCLYKSCKTFDYLNKLIKSEKWLKTTFQTDSWNFTSSTFRSVQILNILHVPISFLFQFWRIVEFHFQFCIKLMIRLVLFSIQFSKPFVVPTESLQTVTLSIAMHFNRLHSIVKLLKVKPEKYWQTSFWNNSWHQSCVSISMLFQNTLRTPKKTVTSKAQNPSNLTTNSISPFRCHWTTLRTSSSALTFRHPFETLETCQRNSNFDFIH